MTNNSVKPRSRWQRPLLIALAVIFLVEAWLWSHLGPAIGWLVDRLPFRKLARSLSVYLSGLSPYRALIAFLVPVLLVEPAKLLAVYLLAHGAIFVGVGVMLAAKLLGMGLMAYVFDACRIALLQIGWFAACYRLAMRAKAWADDLVSPYKASVIRKLGDLKRSVRGWVSSEAKGSGVRRILSILRSRVRRGTSGPRP